jgi:outer membrane protein assembly factor BamB
MAVPVQPTPAQPRELPPGVWEAPPVRRGSANEADTSAHAQTETTAAHRPRVSKRGAFVLIVGMCFLTFGVLGGVGAWVWLKFHRSEEERLVEARADYEQGSYGSAAGKFRELSQKFPDSAHADEYRFLADWCAVCSPAADPDADPAPAVEKLDNFIKEHKKDPFMAQYGHDGGRLTLKLTHAFAERNAKAANDEPLKAVERIEQLRRTVAALGSEALTKAEGGQIDADLTKVRLAVELWRQRRDVLAKLRQGPKETPMDALKRVRSLLASRERDLPGISQDEEAKTALAQLYEAHRASVVYQPRKEEDPLQPKSDRSRDARIMRFAPLLPTAAPGDAPPNDPIVLALVRGILYALKQSNGELKWAMRVGIDTTVLPQRVPALQARPEEFLLVLSADTQTLSARSVENDLLWEYPVGQPVLGRPIIIGPRAYLAAYDGTIHEIELARGQLLGRWSLGQRLTCGGTREGNTNRIYFPADDSCIYVLDVGEKTRRCVTILYDGHPSGSLRSEPVVVPPAENDAAPGYLILNQASGLDAMHLRVFELPLQDGHAAPLTLDPPARLAGWTWFEPSQDGEKLAVLSDAGMLGLFGIRQLGNRDQALFPLLQPGGLDLAPFLQTGRELPRERGRAQMVHMQGDDLWLLAYGRFQQVQLRVKTALGPQAMPGWKTPLTLGSPLHEPQRSEDRITGQATFFLVTQSLEQQMCLASAVDEHGHIVWQRQLGLVCRGEPLTLTPPLGGAPMLLALDRGGGLFSLDAPRPPDKPRSSWRFLKAALDDNPRVPPYLIPAADGHSAYEIAAPGEGRKLIVRHIDWAEGERALRVKQREVSLLPLAGNSVMVPAGPPVVVGSRLIVPMMDGNLMWLPLPLTAEQPSLKSGPTWRDRSAAVTATCNVLALSGDRLLATDGGRGLLVWDWPADKDYRQVLSREGEPLKALENLLAGPPVLLPAKDGQSPRLAVADSAGLLYLFNVTAEGMLQPGRQWDLKGKLTNGPFVVPLAEGGARIGCVVDQRRLVWFDPAKREPLWSYATEGEAIVGEPRIIEDLLVVALPSGRYVGLDPHTGEAKGPGYTLRTSAAPAATPVAFGPGLLFAPLSDGTALLLDVEQLRPPAKK